MTQFDTWVPIDKTTSGAHSSYIQYYRKWHKCSQKVFFFEPYKYIASMVNTSQVPGRCYYKSIYHFLAQPSLRWMQPDTLLSVRPQTKPLGQIVDRMHRRIQVQGVRHFMSQTYQFGWSSMMSLLTLGVTSLTAVYTLLSLLLVSLGHSGITVTEILIH